MNITITTTVSFDHSTYNTYRNQSFAKVTLEWTIMPRVQREDLIGIAHSDALWAINKDSSGLPIFYGKQIYGVSEYNSTSCGGVCLGTEQIKTINYNNTSTNNYVNNTLGGITVMQNLVNDNLSYHSGLTYGDKVTTRIHSLEANFHTKSSSTTSAEFVGVYRHRTDDIASFLLERVNIGLTYADIIDYAKEWYTSDPTYDNPLYSTAEIMFNTSN